MRPGRELNALVAEKIMGLTVEPPSGSVPYPFIRVGKRGRVQSVPNYSNDIAAAWEVVDKMRGVWDISSMPTEWHVRLATQFGTAEKYTEGLAQTAPHAICLAALKAVGALK